MARGERLHLFYGPDSRASSLALSRWIAAFRSKYGEATLYRFEADESGLERLAGELTAAVQSGTLFAEPKLVVVRRSASLDRGRQTASAKRVAALLDGLGIPSREEITVVLWEERDLAEGHPLLERFAAWEAAGAAKRYRFAVPRPEGVARAAQHYFEQEGCRVEPEGVRWLAEAYRQLERNARLQKRVPAGEALAEDERGWWLQRVLEGALLRAEGGTIRLADLRAGAEQIAPAANPFEFADALLAGAWASARTQVWRLEQSEADESMYYGLYAALRWRAERERRQIGRARQLSRLLGELELAAKNFPLEHSWLLELLIERLREGREGRSLLPPRTLWLAAQAR